MKKIVNIIAIFVIAFVTLFSLNAYAASLTGINVTTTKTTIHPGENVTVDIAFGENLGSYTFEVAYDNNLFEYVSSEGGTANDTGEKVIVTFYDTTGGTNPRSSMSVTFKAKDVTTSNSTNFSITASGLANADASTVYDDITDPIVKTVVVEPVQDTTTPDNGTDNDNNNNIDTDTGNDNEQENTTNSEEVEPESMPKTGNTVYMYVIPTIVILGLSYIILKKKN